MKRTLALLALGLAIGAITRWATSPLNPISETATPEAWPLD